MSSPVPHAIAGAGGVGLLIGAALAAEGEPVAFVRTPGHEPPARVRLDDIARGTVEVDAGAVGPDVGGVGVLWITVKATALESLLASLGGAPARVVPLLNGIDHIAALRNRFGAGLVVPATISVEAERVAPGHAVRRTPFADVVFAATGGAPIAAAAATLRAFGLTCSVEDDETTLLWRKLAFLAPLALTTSAAGLSKGAIADDQAWRARFEACARETTAVAAAAGARLDPARPMAMFARAPATMQSSMQKDLAAGRAPELDAIAGPILRGGDAHGIDVATTRELVRRIEARLAGRAA
jgi:2-dehydropantoate 2-reductase